MKGITFSLILLWTLGSVEATTVNGSTGIFELLQGEEIQNIHIQTDLSKLLLNKNSEEDFPSVISWENASGEVEQWVSKLSIRGKFRRQKCDFPPLRLKFSKKELARRGLNRHNKLKLVTHCLEDKAVGQDNVLKEYLAYKLYQTLTPNSFRVQLVRIEYIDESGQYSKLKRYGFLIEDVDDLAERIGGEECDDCINPGPNTLDRKAENLMALFQYYISNTDYNLPMSRNLKLVRTSDQKLTPVPYDFDFAGLIGASYARPNNEFGQINTQDRVFLGLYANDSIMRSNLELFRTKRKEMNNVVRKFKPLSSFERVKMLEFMDNFYTTVEELCPNDSNIFQSLKQYHPAVLPPGGLEEHYNISK